MYKELNNLSHFELQEKVIEQKRELESLRFELNNLQRKGEEASDRSRFQKTIYRLLIVIIAIIAVVILMAALYLPFLRIYGDSMAPTLTDGSIVLTVKDSTLEVGEIAAFYYHDKILVKRVIATAGNYVDIDAEGNVYVNEVLLEEPYLAEKSYGECDITMPYLVPVAKIFAMGDHRSVSLDSRTNTIGCVAEEQIIGKVVFCIWPLSEFGSVK